MPVAPVLGSETLNTGGDGGDRFCRVGINGIEHMFARYQHPETRKAEDFENPTNGPNGRPAAR